MKIQEQDLFHGAALTQIVEHESFKALNKATPAYGHYLVNTDKHIFVKYRNNGVVQNHEKIRFQFQPAECASILQEFKKHHAVYVALVCEKITVCALTMDELLQVIVLDSDSSQWVEVEIRTHGSCHVRGKAGTLSHVVRHNDFPKKIFS